MTEVSSSELWKLEAFPAEGYCILRRTSVRADDLETLRDENRAIIALFDDSWRSWGIVVDMREARARNDESFEEAMKPLRKAVNTHFARVAVLLSSAVGVLQVERLQASETARSRAMRDEDEAIAFARGR